MNSTDYNDSLCVVTGANGFVGSRLVKSLVDNGATVRALVRRTSDLTLLEGTDATLVNGDVCDRESLDEAFDGADYVFHVAGVVKALTHEMFHRVNADACENVCEAIKAVSPKLRRLVHVSSLAAAGPTTPEKPKTEGDEEQPVSVYGLSKLAGERIVLSNADAIPTTLARPPWIYGPGDTGTIELFSALKKHFKVIITGGPRHYSFIYIDDFANALLTAGTHPKALNETFYFSSDEMMTYKAFQNAILESLSTWAMLVPIPSFMMPLFGRIADWMSRRRGKAAVFSRQKVNEALSKAWVCSPNKAREMLGFETKTSIPDGLNKQASWYREMGWL